MSSFLSELKRRHIYRVAAAYAVVAWIVLQIVNNVAPGLNLPNSAITLVIVLLAAGFPIALIFAWVLELKAPTAPSKTGAMDWVLAAVAIAFIGMFAYQQFATSRATVAAQPGVEAQRAAAAKPAGIAIAVLPFENLSGDPSQEFFSNGITEEITSALAKVPDLRVVARTSAYQFKAQNRDIQSIGQQLHATHFIEGSVRKAGDRVRITAQLIKADDGTHIWAEDYDRQLTDIFAIQEDIARAITASLRMPLGLKPGETLIVSRTIDAESYQQYLHAKPLVRARARGVPQAIKILEPLVQRNPDFAPAWAQLSAAYGLSPNYARNGTPEDLRRAVDGFLPKAEMAGRRAIQLDPTLPDGYLALGRVQIERGKYLEAEDLITKGLALDPNSPDGLSQYSNLLANVGRVKESLAMKQQLRALEPYVPTFNVDAGETLWLDGQDEAAIEMIKNTPLSGNQIGDLARIYAALGRYSEALDSLQQLKDAPFPAAANALRMAPAKTDSPQSLPRLGRLWYVYLYVGAEGRALEYYEELLRAGFYVAGGGDNALLWHSSYSELRKTERFKQFVRADGLVDYWKVKGWPEFCHPIGADDFACS